MKKITTKNESAKYQQVGIDVPTARLLSAKQSAAYLGISRQQLYVLINRQQVKPVHIGKRTLIDRFELDRFVDSLAQGGEA